MNASDYRRAAEAFAAHVLALHIAGGAALLLVGAVALDQARQVVRATMPRVYVLDLPGGKRAAIAIPAGLTPEQVNAMLSMLERLRAQHVAMAEFNEQIRGLAHELAQRAAGMPKRRRA